MFIVFRNTKQFVLLPVLTLFFPHLLEKKFALEIPWLQLTIIQYVIQWKESLYQCVFYSPLIGKPLELQTLYFADLFLC